MVASDQDQLVNAQILEVVVSVVFDELLMAFLLLLEELIQVYLANCRAMRSFRLQEKHLNCVLLEANLVTRRSTLGKTYGKHIIKESTRVFAIKQSSTLLKCEFGIFFRLLLPQALSRACYLF